MFHAAIYLTKVNVITIFVLKGVNSANGWNVSANGRRGEECLFVAGRCKIKE
jgi:hypothetical protein